MDKFEYESFSQFRDVVEDLQSCFIDEDAYSRVPALEEWRRASRLCRRLSLLCLELYGYATACRQYQTVSIRERLQVVSNETQQGGEQEEEKTDVGTSDMKSGIIEFTEKEILKMPTHFRKLIIIQKKRCRMRIHKSGFNTISYEIRYRAEGYNISASGKTIELAKENFIKKLKTAHPVQKETSLPTTFHSFATYYFEKARVRLVAKDTFKKDLSRYNLYLNPFFKETPLSKITLTQCQTVIDQAAAQKKFKTANELYFLLNSIFSYAIDNHLIFHNPCDAVILEAYEKVSSVALTKAEEKELLEKMHCEPLFELAFALDLYTGLRPNEIKTARIEGEFIKAENSKRKRIGRTTKRVVEYKRIYICDRLRPYLANGLPTLPSAQLLRRRIKKALPNHILKDLRKTFNSRCKELGVSDHARKAFMGHSLGAVDNTYTELSDAYLLSEGKKLNNW